MLRYPKKTRISKTFFRFSKMDISQVYKNVQKRFPFLLLGKNIAKKVYGQKGTKIMNQ